MQSVALTYGAPHLRLMEQPNDDETERRLLGRALASLRRDAELSQEQAGEKFGTSGQNWAKYELGKSPTIFRPEIQRRLVAAVGASIEELMMKRAALTVPGAKGEVISFQDRAFGRPSFQSPLGLPIRQKILAAWAFDQDDVAPVVYPLGRDQRFPTADQWLAEITDDSADGLGLRRGDLAHLVHTDEIGYYARHGDIVEIERRRPGEDRELTLRQVEVTAAGVRLWAHTSSPRLRDPLDLPADQAAEGGPRIIGLLVNIVRRF